jgi:hypothetical protein
MLTLIFLFVVASARNCTQYTIKSEYSHDVCLPLIRMTDGECYLIGAKQTIDNTKWSAEWSCNLLNVNNTWCLTINEENWNGRVFCNAMCCLESTTYFNSTDNTPIIINSADRLIPYMYILLLAVHQKLII